MFKHSLGYANCTKVKGAQEADPASWHSGRIMREGLDLALGSKEEEGEIALCTKGVLMAKEEST